MEYVRLGRSGVKVSRVILGSWLTFGSSVEDTTTADCVRAALDLGIQTIDTADVYARGEAERVLGEALRGIPRTDIVLASKCFWPMGDGPNDRGLSRKHVFESVEASLKRLRTDYIDLFQCHRFDPEVPLEETVLALEDLVAQGKILYWGTSVWTGAQIEEALGIAGARGRQGPVSNQPPYSLLERDIDAEVLPTCRRLGVGQIVFSPLAQGVLSGKYLAGARPDGSRAVDEKRNVFMGRYLDPAHDEALRGFVDLARELDTTPAVLALAWCLAQPGVDSVIVGATRVDQVAENARAVDLALSDDVLARLDALFPDRRLTSRRSQSPLSPPAATIATMKHVGDLLADLPLPPVAVDLDDGLCGPDLLHDLGADLPAGHLHLWGGPPGAGKTSFLLSLLLGAALRGRRGVYASYHLSAHTLALRMLAMIGALDAEAITSGHLDEEQARRAAIARRCLERLPVHVLEARGYSVPSIEDRLVRMPFRAEVVAVDYLQAVVRNTGTDPGRTVRAFSALASRLHVAFVVAQQGGEESARDVARLADRAGWIAPAGDAGLRRAEVIRNRYGDRSSVPLRLDRASGTLERLESGHRYGDGGALDEPGSDPLLGTP